MSKFIKLFVSLIFISVLPMGFAQASTSLSANIWYGHYSENPLNNPEDPMDDLLYLNITEGTFSGQMVFSFTGCGGDASTVAQIQGSKTSDSLSGTWSAVVDGVSIGGDYVGSYNPSEKAYTGTYSNRDGKKRISCPAGNPIEQYFVAGNGTWEVRAPNSGTPTTINKAGANTLFSWSLVPGAVYYRLAVLDLVCATNSNASDGCVMWQGISLGNNITYGKIEPWSPFQKAPKKLVLNKNYISLLISYSTDDPPTVVAHGNRTFSHR